jgi:NADH:ubiquinone oxidoreductase subunit 4 (subunit M)
LKLGGYGLIRLSCLTATNVNLTLIGWAAAAGGAIISTLCLRQIDMKVLIAYSSVAHIRAVLVAIISQTYLGILTAIVIMVAHGLASSGIFGATGPLYARLHTRNLLLGKGLITS